MTLTIDLEPEQVWLPASESLLDWGDDFHDLLLADELRMSTYRTAITAAVRTGMVVADVGTGTGILAEWALAAGAERVYGIELNPTTLDAAVRRLAKAGMADRFIPVLGTSTKVELAEPVDLVISEILGNLVDNEGCVPILCDARERFLRPDGAMLPRRVESYLVPISAEAAHTTIREGKQRGLPSGAQLESVLNQRGVQSRYDLYYDVILPTANQLAAPRMARSYTFQGNETDVYQVQLVFSVHRPGVFTGFKGYFIADLSEHVTLDISSGGAEGAPASLSWRHCYLPVAEPVEVAPADQIILSFSREGPSAGADPFQQSYRWAGQVRRGSAVVARFAHQTTPR